MRWLELCLYVIVHHRTRRSVGARSEHSPYLGSKCLRLSKAVLSLPIRSLSRSFASARFCLFSIGVSTFGRGPRFFGVDDGVLSCTKLTSYDEESTCRVILLSGTHKVSNGALSSQQSIDTTILLIDNFGLDVASMTASTCSMRILLTMSYWVRSPLDIQSNVMHKCTCTYITRYDRQRHCPIYVTPIVTHLFFLGLLAVATERWGRLTPN